MRLPNHKKNKKPLIIGSVVIVALIGVGIFGYLRFVSGSSTSTGIRGVNDVQYTAATEQEKKESDAIKQKYSDSTSSTSAASQPATLTLSLVRAGQINQTVQIRSYLDGAKNATCTFSLNQNGQPAINKSAAATPSATTASSCNIDIPLSEIPAGGNWNATINAQADTGRANEITTSIEVAKS